MRAVPRAVLLLAVSASACRPKASDGAASDGAASDTAEGCCNGCCIGPGITYPDFPYSDLDQTADDNKANFAWMPAPTEVTVNVDMVSLADGVSWWEGSDFTVADAETAVTAFLNYWNGAGSDLTLVLGDTTKNCCNSLTELGSGCINCLEDEETDIFYWNGNSFELFPTAERAAAGAQPVVSGDTGTDGCNVARDVVLFSEGLHTDDGTTCIYHWTYPYRTDIDCADGVIDVPFKDTLVHELGHVTGLGHPPASLSESVMYQGGTGGCTGDCSYDVVQEPDLSALVELYAQCPS